MKRSNGHIVDARVGITAVNPAPMLVMGVSEMLTGKALDEGLAEAVSDLAARTAKPLTTSALTPEYRREMIRVFTKRAVLAANYYQLPLRGRLGLVSIAPRQRVQLRDQLLL